MKLLFDENVSPRLVESVAQEFPDSAHVRGLGLRGATDQTIWDYACEQGCMIVSKDTDFRERSYVEGFLPRSFGLMSEMREPRRLPGCSDVNVNASSALSGRKKILC